MSEGNFNILAIETCTAAGSVAVIRSSDLKVLALNEWLRGRSHAEVMTPAMEDAVNLVGGFKEISAIAVGIGPGSFTGIRVGLNAARAAAWNLGVPLLPICTTDALLEGVLASGTANVPQNATSVSATVAAVINAQMGHVFVATAKANAKSNEFSRPVAMTPEEFALRFPLNSDQRLLLVGDGVDLIREALENRGVQYRHLDRSLDFPHATTLGRMAARKMVGHNRESLVRNFNWQTAQPLYIRGSGAEEKKG